MNSVEPSSPSPKSAVTTPPPDDFRLLRGSACGAAVFGAAIGLMTALTEREGATATLVGLLFALFGGSVTGLVKSESFNGPARNWVLGITGSIATGIVLGLGIGLVLKLLDDVWLSAGRLDRQVAYIKKLQDSGLKFQVIEGKTIPDLIRSAGKSPLQLFSVSGDLSEQSIQKLIERVEQAKYKQLDKENTKRLDRMSDSLKKMKEWWAFQNELPENLKKLHDDLTWARRATMELEVLSVEVPLQAMIRNLEKAKN